MAHRQPHSQTYAQDFRRNWSRGVSSALSKVKQAKKKGWEADGRTYLKPDADTVAKQLASQGHFVGRVRVADWQGQPIEFLVYKQKPPKSQPKPPPPNVIGKTPLSEEDREFAKAKTRAEILTLVDVSNWYARAGYPDPAVQGFQGLVEKAREAYLADDVDKARAYAEEAKSTFVKPDPEAVDKWNDYWGTWRTTSDQRGDDALVRVKLPSSSPPVPSQTPPTSAPSPQPTPTQPPSAPSAPPSSPSGAYGGRRIASWFAKKVGLSDPSLTKYLVITMVEAETAKAVKAYVDSVETSGDRSIFKTTPLPKPIWIPKRAVR